MKRLGWEKCRENRGRKLREWGLYSVERTENENEESGVEIVSREKRTNIKRLGLK